MEIVLAVAAFVTLLVLSLQHPEWLLYLFILAVPFEAVAVDVGVALQAGKVVILAMAASLAIRKWKKMRTGLADEILGIVALLGLVILVSALLNVPKTADSSGDVMGILRSGLARTGVQSVFFITRACLLLFVAVNNGAPAQLYRSCWLWLISGVFHGTTVIYQWFAFNYGLWNPFTVDLFGKFAYNYRPGLFLLQGQEVFRPNGLFSEPKSMSYYMVGVLILALAGFGAKEHRVLRIAAAAVAAVCLLLSYSTSCWLAVAIAGPFALRTAVGKVSFNKLFAGALIVCAAIGLIIVNRGVILDVIQVRFTDRLTSELDPPVVAAMDVWRESPTTILFGVGVGNISGRIQDLMPTYWRDVVLAPNIDGVGILTSIGIAGSCVIGYLVALVWNRVRLVAKKTGSGQCWHALVITYAILVVVGGVESSGLFWFVFGLIVRWVLETRQPAMLQVRRTSPLIAQVAN